MSRPRRQAQSTISAFTTITKASNFGLTADKKRKHTDNDEATIPFLSLNTTVKKRKVTFITPPTTPTKLKQNILAQTGVKSAVSNLSNKRKRHVSPEIEIAYSSPPESSTESDDFPLELEDFKRLNSAFLSALSLHYAHNGNSTSVDLRMITPSITRLWGKRKATINDIRKIVAVLHLTSTAKSQNVTRFALKDFSEGKVCIEIVAKRLGLKSTATTLNEAETNCQFCANLEHAWESCTKKAEGAEAFIEALPLEPMSMAASVAKIAPMRAKGQRRLEEVLTPFKNFNLSESPSSPSRSAKRVKNTHLSTFDLPVRVIGKENLQPEAQAAQPEPAKDRSLSLLDRIQKKEALAASLPKAPTKEERERRAALQRSEELLEIINLLALAKGGAARASFPLASLVASIQSSIRSPMAKDDVLRCIKVLTIEVAPGHVSMVTFGSVVGVVVDRNRRPPMAEIRERLRLRGVC